MRHLSFIYLLFLQVETEDGVDITLIGDEPLFNTGITLDLQILGNVSTQLHFEYIL